MSTVKGNFTNVSADAIRPYLGSNLRPYAQDFVDAGHEYGLDPRFLAAISKLETGNGTSPAFRKGNNAMGISNSRGPLYNFKTPRESIFRQARSLARPDGYYRKAKTIEEIGRIYAPPGAGNDPKGTNSYWPRGVGKFYREMVSPGERDQGREKGRTATASGGDGLPLRARRTQPTDTLERSGALPNDPGTALEDVPPDRAPTMRDAANMGRMRETAPAAPQEPVSATESPGEPYRPPVMPWPEIRQSDRYRHASQKERRQALEKWQGAMAPYLEGQPEEVREKFRRMSEVERYRIEVEDPEASVFDAFKRGVLNTEANGRVLVANQHRRTIDRNRSIYEAARANLKPGEAILEAPGHTPGAPPPGFGKDGNWRLLGGGDSKDRYMVFAVPATTPKSMDLEQFETVTSERINEATTKYQDQMREAIKAGALADSLPKSREVREFLETKGGGASMKVLVRNLGPIMAHTVFESAPSIVAPVAGSVAGPGGAAMGSYAVEYAASFREFLQEEAAKKGLDVNTEEGLAAALTDPAITDVAETRAARRAAPIAGVDAMTMGLAGMLAKKIGGKTLGRIVARAAVATPADAAGGAAGELAAQVASGQDIDPKAAALEAIGQVATGTAGNIAETVTAERATNPTPQQRPQGLEPGTYQGATPNDAAARVNLDPQPIPDTAQGAPGLGETMTPGEAQARQQGIPPADQFIQSVENRQLPPKWRPAPPPPPFDSVENRQRPLTPPDAEAGLADPGTPEGDVMEGVRPYHPEEEIEIDAVPAANDNEVIVYHGGEENLTLEDRAVSEGRDYGAGLPYWTDSESIAANYARGGDEGVATDQGMPAGRKVHRAAITINAPFNLDFESRSDVAQTPQWQRLRENIRDKVSAKTNRDLDYVEQQDGFANYQSLKRMLIEPLGGMVNFRTELAAAGYDGIVAQLGMDESKQYIPFSKDQIRLLDSPAQETAPATAPLQPGEVADAGTAEGDIGDTVPPSIFQLRDHIIGEDFPGTPNTVAIQVRDLSSNPIGDGRPIEIPVGETLAETEAAVFSGYERLVDSVGGSMRESVISILGPDGKAIGRMRWTPNGMETSSQTDLETARNQMAATQEQVERDAGQSFLVEDDPNMVFSGPGTILLTPTARNQMAATNADQSTRPKTRGGTGLPVTAFEAKVRAEATRAGLLKKMEQTEKKLRRQLKVATGKSEYSLRGAAAHDQLLRQLNRALTGDLPIGRLPQNLQPVAAEMRMLVDQLSQALIDAGLVEGDVAAAIAENKGVYLNRSYRVFDDPGWARKVPEEIRNRAKGFFRREYAQQQGETAEQYAARIDGLMEALLFNRGPGIDGPMAVLSESSDVARMVQNILKKRGDIPPELRALWGEYQTADVNFARTIAKQAQLIASHQFLTEVRETGLNRYLFEEPRPGFGRQIVKPNGPNAYAMGPIAGLYSTPEIVAAFESIFARESVAGWVRVMGTMNSLAKVGKTVMNPITQVRNFKANLLVSVAMGNLPINPALLFKTAKAYLTELLPQGVVDGLERQGFQAQEWRDYVAKLTRLQVLDESVAVNDLQATIKDAMGGKITMDEFIQNRFKRAARKVLSVPMKFYAAGDGLWKVYNFEAELGKLRRAFPDRTEAELEAEASMLIREMMPTYSLIPEFIKKLRRFPFMGTFVSFWSEIFRTQKNLVSRINYELNTDGYRSIGARRLAGMLAAHTTILGVAAAGRMWYGMKKEEEEALRRLAAPWDQNAMILPMGRDDKGNWQFINLSYTDPYAQFKRPFLAMLRDDLPTENDKFKAAMMELFGPIVQEELASEALIDIARNKKGSSGTQLWNEKAPESEIIKAKMWRLWEAVEPGAFTTARRIKKAITGEKSRNERAYDLETELRAVMTGDRIVTIDPINSLGFRARDFDRGWGESTKLFSSIVGNRGTVSADEIRQGYENMMHAKGRLMSDLTKDMHAAIRLGGSAEEVMITVRANGVGPDNAELAMVGQMRGYQMSDYLFKKAALIPGRLAMIRQAVGDQIFTPKQREQVQNQMAAGMILAPSVMGNQ